MTLPRPRACLFAHGRGNANNKLRPEKVQSSCFRTGVRFPSAPPLRNDLCMSGGRASAPASTAKVFLRSKSQPLCWVAILFFRFASYSTVFTQYIKSAARWAALFMVELRAMRNTEGVRPQAFCHRKMAAVRSPAAFGCAKRNCAGARSKRSLRSIPLSRNRIRRQAILVCRLVFTMLFP